MDELVAAHPELDEKALRRGYAQVKSKSKGSGKVAKVSKKKASKKAGRKPVAQERGAVAPPSPPADPEAPKPKADPEVRALILRKGIDAIKAAIAELQS